VNAAATGIGALLLILTLVLPSVASVATRDLAWVQWAGGFVADDEVVIGPASTTGVVVVYRGDQSPTPVVLSLSPDATTPALLHRGPLQNAPRSPPASPR
jgi:hypothetical protein